MPTPKHDKICKRWEENSLRRRRGGVDEKR